MDVGDVVSYQGTRWVVLSRDSAYRVWVLSNWDAQKISIPDRLGPKSPPGVEVVHRPREWPFVALPTRAKSGKITEVYREGLPLEPFRDWVPSSMFGAGGSIFFHPLLKLQLGEVLTLVHERGTRSRVTINRSFGTATHKKRRMVEPWKPLQPKTAYDRLMGKDPFGD